MTTIYRDDDHRYWMKYRDGETTYQVEYEFLSEASRAYVTRVRLNGKPVRPPSALRAQMKQAAYKMAVRNLRARWTRLGHELERKRAEPA